MPATPTVIGFAAFAGIKFIGYSAAAKALKDAYNRPSASALKVGLVRTVIGIVTGVSYGGLWLLAAMTWGPAAFPAWSGFLFYLLLLPIRLGEWSLLVWLFFDRPLQDKRRLAKYAAQGTGWSYMLDVVGVLTAVVVPGGAWIC